MVPDVVSEPVFLTFDNLIFVIFKVTALRHPLMKVNFTFDRA